MKHLFTISLLFIGLFHSNAQTDTTAVPFVSYWSVGDSYDFKVTKIKQQWKGEKQTKNDTSSYEANFLVLDSTATSYRIKWSFNTQWEQYNVPQEFVDKFSKYSVTEVIYKTSEVGDFVEIENWEEISEMMNGLFTDLINVMSESENSDKGSLTAALNPFLALYQTQEGIESLVFKEIQIFHFPLGIEFTVGETLRYEEEIPNMLGGSPIKGQATIYIENVDFEEGYCDLIQDLTLDPDDTRDMIYKFLKKAKIGDKEMKKMMKTAKVDISDHNRFEYYYYPGVPLNIETTRTTIIDISDSKGKRVDKIIIELL